MRSLESRELARKVVNWAHKYYFLTDSGVEYLREYLHLDADVKPKTQQAPARGTGERERRGGERGERGERRGGDRDFRRGGERGGFKKDGGAPSGNWRPQYAGEGAGRGRGGSRADYRE